MSNQKQRIKRLEKNRRALPRVELQIRPVDYRAGINDNDYIAPPGTIPVVWIDYSKDKAHGPKIPVSQK